ncbi:EAL domain-containing protein [bacterium M00.F.Ca.ET.228.01.1.1]|uniref:putative bifunctional diguanylate cyclase/phosphodiesterase n=1 Tax=Paraburkholderia phenoliruptrix TaxID=252970 RepID=UPI0010924418|nr:EAL domain-containing protein [Paraburkholderia phenoliruptrix]TGP41637.1 EAL domain-containing protein [bacterium M00.F.Ca.ET.228.01.1.1]TGR98428.1 EAL domain-containing protein [bacterium M00.F.Ca.ET.191.01.1.1]TGU02762.1 EAL domain-containing protein [bacterium M00.F.Ca.ET.155.01.1.1]MBW0447568.1 EAL domain-containing protein [Paraburkholderia phenoliruptrix]MBW9098229.1 EAL domain-containing protein [Paraburkholderia phenoliruptrix]
MNREATSRTEVGATPEGCRVRPDLAEEVLESERSVLRLITCNTPLPEVLDEVCRRAEALLGEGASCSILLLDEDGVHVRVGGAPSLPKRYSAAIDGVRIGPCAGSCGTAMYERRLVVVEDIETDPLWADYRALALPYGLRACWSVPFENDTGAVLGAFAVYHREPRRPTAQEETMLRDIGRSVGLAVHQNAMAQRLAHSEEHHRLVVDHLIEGIVVQSRAGVVLACNPSAQRMLRTGPQIVGRSIRTVMVRSFHENGSPVAEEERPTNQVLATGKPMLDVTLALELVNGEVIWVTENVVPILKPGQSKPDSVLISFTDIGPVREAQRQLKFLATRDSLTGLYNRAYLTERMHSLFAPGGPNGSGEVVSVAVLFVDLDGFKKVNDTAGHEAGDALLRSVAERLAGCVRHDDTLARVGGDEFVIVVSACDCNDQLVALARRILDAIAVPFAVAENEYYLGASIGISRYPEDGQDAPTLMRNADSAMYHAKQRGRNNFQFFTAELNQQLQRRFVIEQLLRRALAANELSLVYQPIVDSHGGRTIGAEALLRWYNSELGNVSPAEFIPVAEDAGLIAEIGEWVLAHACEQAAQWRRTLAPDLIVAVNLSPRQFNDGLVERIRRCLDQSGLEPAALELEITERLLMSDSDTVLPMLQALSATGVRISVDDFGTGYSSLSYLKRFPLHNLKIDRSFVAGLPDHRDSIAITQAVVAMAHSLGMNVTAEGVETPEQAAFLRSIDCDKQQGYLYSRPVGASAYARALANVCAPAAG